MQIENSVQPTEAAPASPLPAPARSKNQIKATVLADGLARKAKWKSLLAEAAAVWDKVPADDLAHVDGNFHKLAGQVQMRYRISREESDRQVRDFFDKHFGSA